MDQKWQSVSKVPPAYLKKIGFGALQGKSDINPQWRIKAMTEVYGLCGIGWYHELAERWTEEGAKGDRMVFVKVHVYIKDGDKWSAPIVGLGGNTTIDSNKNGLVSSDEGWKMAYTDALGTALKSIGVASEIYEGSWDGSKYNKMPGPTVNVAPEKPVELPVLTDPTALLTHAFSQGWHIGETIEKAKLKYKLTDAVVQIIADRYAERETK